MNAIRIRDTLINLDNVNAAQFGDVPTDATAEKEPGKTFGVVVYYNTPGTTTTFACETEDEARGILKEIETAFGL